jgi:hypothetical protein
MALYFRAHITKGYQKISNYCIYHWFNMGNHHPIANSSTLIAVYINHSPALDNNKDICSWHKPKQTNRI